MRPVLPGRFTAPVRPTVPVLSILALTASLWVFPQTQLQVGYTVLAVTTGSIAPVATALFTYTNPAGVLVSQAGVAAAVPISPRRR
jgi:hypothetical protein